MSTIGRYQILQNIGQGGMGTLYLARDPLIDRLVAIKVLREGVDNDDIRERFTREARSAGRLRHINIVTIHDVGEHDGQPFIAMEYVQGETLGDLIRRLAPIPIVRKLLLMDELCAGLHYAHRAGVVHRDIKPANLMMDEEGVLKILDFGIARLGASGMTQAGTVMGTLNYMAPEQMEGRPIDARVDIFSVGAVLYELFAYKRAFPGEIPGILHKIMSGSPEPLQRVCPGLDAALIATVYRCLEKNPDARYPDLAAVRRDLAAVRLRYQVEPTHEADETIEIRPRPTVDKPSSDTPSSDPPAPKPLRKESSREERLRIRAEQIQTHVQRARTAIEAADYDGALQSCHQALLIDPENAAALELEDRARTAAERRQVREWVNEARGELERGALTAASALVDRALSLEPTSPDAIGVQRAVEQARREAADAQARAREFERTVAESRRHLEAGAIDEAKQEVDKALAIEADNTAALALKHQIEAAQLAKRREEEEARVRADLEARARAMADDARRHFAAGDQAGALDRLAAFQPRHAAVTTALAELRVAFEETERRRLEAERQRLEEARRQQDAARRRDEEEARRRNAEEQRRQEEAEQRRAEELRAAAEAADRLKREIARKLTDASTRLAQQDFDGAFSLTRSILATQPKHPDALAVDAQIVRAFERHRQIVAGLAAARALFERGRLQETLDAVGRLALLDPKAAGLADLRHAAESGLAEAEAVAIRRREAKEVERRRLEEERLRAEAEARRRAEEEQRRRAEQEAARRRADEEARRLELEAQQQAERETTQRKADEQRRAEQEAKRLQAEEQRRAREEATRLQQEGRRRAQEAKQLKKDEQRRQAEEVRQAARARQQAEASAESPTTADQTVVLPARSPATDANQDATVFIEPTPATATSRLAVPRAVLLTAAALAAVGVMIWAGLKLAPQRQAPPPPPRPTAVVLNVAPWAKIESITRTSDGQIMAGRDLVTPCIIALPPGEYRLRASNPGFQQPLDVTLTVGSGAVQEIQLAMPGFDPDTEILNILPK